MTGHACEAGNDPRKQESCVRCGRLIPPPAPVVDLCDLAFETELLLNAGRKAGVDARVLDAFSKARKLPGPVVDHLTRDLTLDGQEEGADWVHYLVWDYEAEAHKGTLTVDMQWHFMEALGHVAAAFHHAQQITALKRKGEP